MMSRRKLIAKKPALSKENRKALMHLVKKITVQNRHGETLTGPERGKEKVQW